MRVELITCLFLLSSFEAAVAQGILGIDRRERFRIYAMGERRPSFTYPGTVKVGTVLPDDGVVDYDVPPEFALPVYSGDERQHAQDEGYEDHQIERSRRRFASALAWTGPAGGGAGLAQRLPEAGRVALRDQL